jgi:predicted Zn-dependent peptidase
LPSWRSVWDLVVEGVSQPPFSSYELDYYRLQYQRGFMSERDDPAAAAGIDAFSRQFQGDAFNLLRDGKDELTGLALDDVFYAWHDFFERRRLLVTVVGDVDRRAVNAAVGALARWLYPDAAPSFPAQPVNKLAQFDLEVLKYADSPNWYIDSYFRGPVASSPDYAAFSLGLEVLDQRLFREVRDVRGLAYTTGARASFYRNSYGHLWLASEAPREALPVASQLIADLQTLGPDQDELQSARARMRTELYGYGDEPAGLASLIADWELTAGAHEALEDYLIELDSAQPAQVAAALSAYLRNVKTCAAGGGSELIEEDLSPLFASP